MEKSKNGTKFINLKQSNKDNYNVYTFKNNNFTGRYGGMNIISILDDDFQILEDKPEGIEELKEILRYIDLTPPFGKNEDMMWGEIIKHRNKINELIKEVNNLKGGNKNDS